MRLAKNLNDTELYEMVTQSNLIGELIAVLLSDKEANRGLLLSISYLLQRGDSMKTIQGKNPLLLELNMHAAAHKLAMLQQ